MGRHGEHDGGHSCGPGRGGRVRRHRRGRPTPGAGGWPPGGLPLSHTGRLAGGSSEPEGAAREPWWAQLSRNAAAGRSAEPPSGPAAAAAPPDRWVPVIDLGACTACGICASSCPQDAIQVNQIAKVDAALCSGCGACAAQCPSDAIRMEKRVAGTDAGRH